MASWLNSNRVLKLLCLTTVIFVVVWLFEMDFTAVHQVKQSRMDTAMTTVFRARRQHLRQMCSRYKGEVFRTTKNVLLGEYPDAYPNITRFQQQHILVDHGNQLLYCFVPKIGSTNWKKVFLMLRGVCDADAPNDIMGSIAHENQRSV